MMPRVIAMGLLLALGLACGKQRGFDSIREEAAGRGNRHYQNQMGVIYQTGKDGDGKKWETDYVKALNWFIAAGTPTNHVVQKGEKVVDLLKRYRVFFKDLKNNKANRTNGVDFVNMKPGTRVEIPGFGPAMYNAGAIYETRYKKLKIEKEDALEKAAEWYAKGAEAGFVRAQFAYGYALERGQGVEEKDLKQAGNWYELSAKQGLAAAQGRLARLHFYGFGDLNKRNLIDAYLWYGITEKTLKAEGKELDRDLATAIDTCRRSLPPGDQVRVERLIQDFRALEK